MNKFKYLTLTILLSSLSITNVYASCTKEEIDAFKEIEDEYTVTYELNEQTKTYDVILYNPEPKKYKYNVEIEVPEYHRKKIDENNEKYYGIPVGEYEIQIIGKTSNCKDALKKVTIKIPRYNSYADDTLCDGIEEFVLCQPEYDKELDYETFVSRVETYKRTKKEQNQLNKNNQEQTKNEDSSLNFIEKSTEYIKNNLVKVIIIITFIILLTITIIITIKSLKKSRRLE